MHVHLEINPKCAFVGHCNLKEKNETEATWAFGQRFAVFLCLFVCMCVLVQKKSVSGGRDFTRILVCFVCCFLFVLFCFSRGVCNLRFQLRAACGNKCK